jgi:hypothetical protein
MRIDARVPGAGLAGAMVLLGLGTFSAKPKTSTRFTHHPIAT